MNGRILVGLFLCSLFLVVGGDAQSPDIPFSGYMRADGEKPIWALEFIKVQPENFAVAMQYLDDHWMRVRAEAKRHGAVLDYHLISNAGIVTPGHKAWDQDSIVLLTKDKNMDAFMDSQHASHWLPDGRRVGCLHGQPTRLPSGSQWVPVWVWSAAAGGRPFRTVEYPSIRGRAGHKHRVQASHQAVGLRPSRRLICGGAACARASFIQSMPP